MLLHLKVYIMSHHLIFLNEVLTYLSRGIIYTLDTTILNSGCERIFVVKCNKCNLETTTSLYHGASFVFGDQFLGLQFIQDLTSY